MTGLRSCRQSAHSYNPRVLDIKLIREKPDFVRERLATRGAGDESRIETILQLDQLRRNLLSKVEALKSERNQSSKEIGGLIAQKKLEEAEARKSHVRRLGDQIAEIEKELKSEDSTKGGAEIARDRQLLHLP